MKLVFTFLYQIHLWLPAAYLALFEETTSYAMHLCSCWRTSNSELFSAPAVLKTPGNQTKAAYVLY